MHGRWLESPDNQSPHTRHHDARATAALNVVALDADLVAIGDYDPNPIPLEVVVQNVDLVVPQTACPLFRGINRAGREEQADALVRTNHTALERVYEPSGTDPGDTGAVHADTVEVAAVDLLRRVDADICSLDARDREVAELNVVADVWKRHDGGSFGEVWPSDNHALVHAVASDSQRSVHVSFPVRHPLLHSGSAGPAGASWSRQLLLERRLPCQCFFHRQRHHDGAVDQVGARGDEQRQLACVGPGDCSLDRIEIVRARAHGHGCVRRGVAVGIALGPEVSYPKSALRFNMPDGGPIDAGRPAPIIALEAPQKRV